MILNLRDNEGNWQAVSAIRGAKGEKGDKGDTYTLTPDDYSSIADLVYEKLPKAEEARV